MHVSEKRYNLHVQNELLTLTLVTSIASRCRQVLADYNMSCDDVSTVGNCYCPEIVCE